MTFLIPVFAVVWGWIFLDEGLTPQMVIGCAVILVGTGLTTGVLKLRSRQAARTRVTSAKEETSKACTRGAMAASRARLGLALTA